MTNSYGEARARAFSCKADVQLKFAHCDREPGHRRLARSTCRRLPSAPATPAKWACYLPPTDSGSPRAGFLRAADAESYLVAAL